jgi:hypothetical protein
MTNFGGLSKLVSFGEAKRKIKPPCRAASPEQAAAIDRERARLKKTGQYKPSPIKPKRKSPPMKSK